MADIIQFPRGEHQHTVVDALRICVNHCADDGTINEGAQTRLLDALDSLEAYIAVLSETDS